MQEGWGEWQVKCPEKIIYLYRATWPEELSAGSERPCTTIAGPASLRGFQSSCKKKKKKNKKKKKKRTGEREREREKKLVSRVIKHEFVCERVRVFNCLFVFLIFPGTLRTMFRAPGSSFKGKAFPFSLPSHSPPSSFLRSVFTCFVCIRNAGETYVWFLTNCPSSRAVFPKRLARCSPLFQRFAY